MKLNLILALSAIGLISACGGNASNKPNTISVVYEKNKITGKYNPAEFSSEDIKKLLMPDCRANRVSGYSEQTSSRGLIAFTAICDGGNLITDGVGEITVQAANSTARDVILSDRYGNLSRQIVKTEVPE